MLDFEKPIHELESKIRELRHLSGDGQINIAAEVTRLQAKVERLLRQTYKDIAPEQIVQVARHPERPHFLDYVKALVTDFTPLAGDPFIRRGCRACRWYRQIPRPPRRHHRPGKRQRYGQPHQA
jgi:acetyl-CoA carboxylase carboxyl transferase subunit alpha